MAKLFVAIEGSGWVADEGGQRFSITSGEAVLWSPGEMHESGSDDGMLVVIAQSSTPFGGIEQETC